MDGPIEPYLDECRARIERDAPEDERENLRVVTHFFAGLQYNDPRLFEKLGGNMELLKTGSPLLRGMFEEVRREARREAAEARREPAEANVITVLKARFGPEAEALVGELKELGEARFKPILEFAATCPDLASFRAQVATAKRTKRRK